jgi:hypothetical protein
MDSCPDIVRVATGRLKPVNLYLATVQKMGGTSDGNVRLICVVFFLGSLRRSNASQIENGVPPGTLHADKALAFLGRKVWQTHDIDGIQPREPTKARRKD